MVSVSERMGGGFKIFKIYEGGPERICRNRGVVRKICKNLVSPPSPPCLYLMTGPLQQFATNRNHFISNEYDSFISTGDVM